MDNFWEWLENRGLAFWVMIEMIALLAIFLPLLLILVPAMLSRFEG